MTTATKMVYCWQTTKTSSGYAWSVYKAGYEVPTETIKTGVAATRATATATAKRWMMHLKSISY